MRTVGVVCAAVAMFGLTAAKCTEDEITAVAVDYRANTEAAAESIEVPADSDEATVDTADIPEVPTETGPTTPTPGGGAWDVVADCNGAQVTLSGWTDAEGLFKGEHFAIFGMGAAPPHGIPLDETGGFNGYINAGSATEGEVFRWSLTIGGTGLDVTGMSDC